MQNLLKLKQRNVYDSAQQCCSGFPCAISTYRSFLITSRDVSYFHDITTYKQIDKLEENENIKEGEKNIFGNRIEELMQLKRRRLSSCKQ